jgi:hypothetical protein
MIVCAAALLIASGAAVAQTPYSAPMRDVENAAHSPLQFQVTIEASTGSSPALFITTPSLPAHKRMVIEHVGFRCHSNNPAVTLLQAEFSYIDDQGTQHFFHVVPTTVPLSGVLIYGDAYTRLYHSAGQITGSLAPNAIGAFFQFSNNLDIHDNCRVEVFGYTINLP